MPASTQAPTQTPESNPEKHRRTYVVLEEVGLDVLVERALEGTGVEATDEVLEALGVYEVLRKVGTPAARNTEHAHRQAAKLLDVEGESKLISVPDRMWNPTTVTVRATHHVSVG